LASARKLALKSVNDEPLERAPRVAVNNSLKIRIDDLKTFEPLT